RRGRCWATETTGARRKVARDGASGATRGNGAKSRRNGTGCPSPELGICLLAQGDPPEIQAVAVGVTDGTRRIAAGKGSDSRIFVGDIGCPCAYIQLLYFVGE